MLYSRRPQMNEILKNPTFALFAILFLGMALGNIKFKGITLGSSGVLFVALAAGHYGLEVPMGISGLGTALFVYCVGLGVGNRFFASLASQGSRLVLLSVCVVGMGWLGAFGLGKLFGIDSEIMAGIFAGSLTSTPALAAASEALSDSALLNIGYGVAYPFGVIGVVLFVQLLPRLLKQDLSTFTPSSEQNHHGKDQEKIIRRVITVANSDIFGKSIEKFESNSNMLCRVIRIIEDGRMRPIEATDTFEEGVDVLLIGSRANMHREYGFFGHMHHSKQHPRSFGDESAELIVLSPKLCGMPLGELKPLTHYGIVISRITRLGEVFVPNSDTELVRNDVVRVVGPAEAIEKFSSICGHRSTALNATDILSLTGGVALGILVGNIKFSLGDSGSFSLGMAGGPLIVALILGHFGKVGPLVGYMPRPSRIFIMELALMLFLAAAGVAGGERLVETLQAQGLMMLLAGFLVTLIPLVVGFVIARRVLKMPLPESLGGICGAMTSTPALGAITSKTDLQSPIIAYATAYPAALILMTFFAKLILAL